MYKGVNNMVGHVVFSMLCMISTLTIINHADNHWGWLVVKIIFFVLYCNSLYKALDKEKEFLKRIEELEETHKEKE
jgi:hypothetical protein